MHHLQGNIFLASVESEHAILVTLMMVSKAIRQLSTHTNTYGNAQPYAQAYKKTVTNTRGGYTFSTRIRILFFY